MYFKHYIWDFDGTLFDTYPFIVSSFRKALGDFGVIESEENIYTHMMDSLRHTFDYYDEKYHLGDELISRHKQYMRAESAVTSPPFPEVKEVLHTILDRGGANYINTHRGASTHALLQDAGMAHCFAEIITRENGFARKPDPEAIRYLLGKYEMDPAETLMIGDRELDILSGRLARVSACQYAGSALTPIVKADYHVRSLTEIPSLKIRQDTEWA